MEQQLPYYSNNRPFSRNAVVVVASALASTGGTVSELQETHGYSDERSRKTQSERALHKISNECNLLTLYTSQY